MTAERKYFSGNSLEIALMQAARHHGLQPEEVAYRRIEKRHGFLRSRKGVVIEVDPAAPRLTAESASVEVEEVIAEVESPVVEATPAPSVGGEPVTGTVEESPAPREEPEPQPEPQLQPEPEAQAEPEAVIDSGAGSEEPEPSSVREDDYRSVEPTEELREAARRGLEDIMSFAKLDLKAEVTDGEGQLEIELSGPDRPRLVEDRGNLLLAFQHLLPRLIRGYTGRSIPCHVDSENFHATREVELEKLALEAAQEVLERQKPRTLPPMNPAERRIIHVTLADNKEVATESQGKGFFKRLTISPAMRRPRGFDRY